MAERGAMARRGHPGLMSLQVTIAVPDVAEEALTHHHLMGEKPR